MVAESLSMSWIRCFGVPRFFGAVHFLPGYRTRRAKEKPAHVLDMARA
jgi:hypothetical protein